MKQWRIWKNSKYWKNCGCQKKLRHIVNSLLLWNERKKNKSVTTKKKKNTVNYTKKFNVLSFIIPELTKVVLNTVEWKINFLRKVWTLICMYKCISHFECSLINLIGECSSKSVFEKLGYDCQLLKLNFVQRKFCR